MKILQWLLQLLVELLWPPKTVTNPIPSLPTDPITGGLDVAAEALALGLTVEQYKLSPTYQAALLTAKKKQDIDAIRAAEQKAEAGDPEALKQMREDVS